MTEALALPGGAGLGSAPMGGPGWQLDWGPSDPDESVAAVRAAVAAGVGWIDTAPFYGWGRAEKLIGTALEGMTTRPVVLTKCGDVRGPDGRAVDDHRGTVIRADVRASLRRLRCPVIDVLQLHDPDPGTPIEESWQTICELIDQGAVRAGGLSNHPVELMDRAPGHRPDRRGAAPVLAAAPCAGGRRRTCMVPAAPGAVPGLVPAGLRIPRRRFRPGRADRR
jgi:aryl-alcohol dehydrogenase-like predicted oxidoreductase